MTALGRLRSTEAQRFFALRSRPSCLLAAGVQTIVGLRTLTNERIGVTSQDGQGSADSARTRGRLVVLAGPSAVGKSTVVAELRERIDDLYFSVSMTTRAPRPGEVDGRDYFFVSKDDFQAAIDAGRMLEWAEIHSGIQLSGTPAAPVEDALDAGRPVLVEVDLAGVRAIKSTAPDAQFVFLAPPSWEELERRLRSRGTETEEVVERRLTTAREEMDAQDEFDTVVVNDDISESVDKLVQLLVGPGLDK